MTCLYIYIYIYIYIGDVPRKGVAESRRSHWKELKPVVVVPFNKNLTRGRAHHSYIVSTTRAATLTALESSWSAVSSSGRGPSDVFGVGRSVTPTEMEAFDTMRPKLVEGSSPPPPRASSLMRSATVPSTSTRRG